MIISTDAEWNHICTFFGLDAYTFWGGASLWLHKESACNGDPGLIPGSGRSPGEGNGNPLQYSCLGNPMDREAWWATVGVAKSQARLSNQHTFITLTF